MKKILTLSLLFILSIHVVSAQNSYLKLIEKGKYPKAEKKITKALKKDSTDISANYSYAILLSKREHKGYDIAKSYQTILKSKQLFEAVIDQKQLAKLNKVPINSDQYRNYLDTICRKALEDIIPNNSVDLYQQYLDNYHFAPTKLLQEATDKRNESAFSIAKSNNSIESFEDFIVKYPYASQREQAQEEIHKLAFNIAEKENTSNSYKKFVNTYPKSKQFKKAFTLFEERQFYENIETSSWETYKFFIEEFPKNSWVKAAQDSIYNLSIKENIIHGLDYCAKNLTGIQKKNAIVILHAFFTTDGEKETLDLFYNDYSSDAISDIMVNDYELAKLGDDLMLHLPYNNSNFINYDNYIKTAAPKEKAFVALQRLISNDVASKNWSSALKTVTEYSTYFGKDNSKINNLISLLQSKWNNTIKIMSVGNKVNTSTGGEYVPVLSADEKLLYFCGKDRKDNIGGEDIFVSRKINNTWEMAKIVPDLSSSLSNDAPLSVSSDGTTMLLFKSGKIYYSEKTNFGWSEAIPFPENINSAKWQSDAMITSDGKALLFASTKAGGYNFFDEPIKYHGDNLYPSDIYISTKNNDDTWGEPINLGEAINTTFCDRMPFLHPDMKTLYFSSDGHGGLGKMDVFKSTRLSDTCWNCWSEPVNLGIEINTTESDAGYKIATSGDKAYFSFEKKSFSESSVLFLLDVSGSMAGDKIESLKAATISVCQTSIDNNAEVAILLFDGNCAEPISKIHPFTKDMGSLTDFINAIYAYGMTPMNEAYYNACFYMKSYSNPTAKNKVITLMTDGDSNGCYDLDEVLKLVKSKRLVYKTQTIAYDVNEYSKAGQDLKKISAFSNGKFYAAQGTDELGSTFENANNDIFNINSSSNNRDIFWLNLPASMRPDYVATVSGKLLDKKNKPISAEIRWEDLETGKSIGQSKSDPADGSFFIVLPLGKIYGYYVDKDQHFPISNNIDLRKNDKPVQITQNIDIVTFKQMMEDSVAVPVNNLFFKFAESTLLSYSIPELNRVAKIINDHNLKVLISGHTDNIGDDAQNQILSEKRANSVKEFLVSVGCNTENLITKGFGESKPITTNETETGRAKNRRVELNFIP